MSQAEELRKALEDAGYFVGGQQKTDNGIAVVASRPGTPDDAELDALLMAGVQLAMKVKADVIQENGQTDDAAADADEARQLPPRRLS